MADYKATLKELQEFLDWNRWMVVGLALWGLLVAVVLGVGPYGTEGNFKINFITINVQIKY